MCPLHALTARAARARSSEPPDSSLSLHSLRPPCPPRDQTPRLRDLGALGIVAGLLLTVWSDRVAGALGLPDIACRPVRLEGDEALLLAAGSSLSAGAPTDGAGDKA